MKLRVWLSMVLLFCCSLVAAQTGADAPEVDDYVPPANLADGWYARIETTEGRILVRLHPEQAPQSVSHFVKLAQGELKWFDAASGQEHDGHYYDGVPIHKALAMQRFEAGDRGGTGRSAPSLFVEMEGAGPVDFSQPWRLGMTVGSGGKISAVQFFVASASQSFLNGRHPCFGTVIGGKDVVQRITTVKTYTNGRPIAPVVIEKIRAFAVGEVEPLAEPVIYKPTPAVFELNDKQDRFQRK